MKKEIKVGLVWHNLDSSNYGVGALAIAHIGMVLQAAEKAGIEVCLETYGSQDSPELKVRKEAEEIFGRNISHVNFSLRKLVHDLRRFEFKFINKLRDYDIVLDIGEGDSFSDIYGLRRFFAHATTKIIAISVGTPLVICPQTIGPFNASWVRRLAAYILSKSKVVFVRDDKSCIFAKELGVQACETTDVAFSLPFIESSTEKDAIGLNVSGLLLSGGYTGKNQFGLGLDYRDFCLKFIKAFLDRGKIVHLISHVISSTSSVEDDFRACQRIKNEYLNDESVVLAPRFLSPMKAKSYISGMSFFVGSRMHATIAAFSAGVPTLPLAYSRKFAGVFGGLGYFDTLDARTENSDALIKKITMIYDEDLRRIVRTQKAAVALATERNNKYIDDLAKELSLV